MLGSVGVVTMKVCLLSVLVAMKLLGIVGLLREGIMDNCYLYICMCDSIHVAIMCFYGIIMLLVFA